MDDVDTINLLHTGDKMESLQQTETSNNSRSEPIYHVILTDIVSGVIDCIANNNILCIRDVVEVYEDAKKWVLSMIICIHQRGGD